mmetsp:Transcript_4756/g.11887  ORF Transcript_4756/g.11887 Transcript_4756/m.11887 type:complete len:208 (+) Transcript_4756:73-696(+)
MIFTGLGPGDEATALRQLGAAPPFPRRVPPPRAAWSPRGPRGRRAPRASTRCRWPLGTRAPARPRRRRAIHFLCSASFSIRRGRQSCRPWGPAWQGGRTVSRPPQIPCLGRPWPTPARRPRSWRYRDRRVKPAPSPALTPSTERYHCDQPLSPPSRINSALHATRSVNNKSLAIAEIKAEPSSSVRVPNLPVCAVASARVKFWQIGS